MIKSSGQDFDQSLDKDTLLHRRDGCFKEKKQCGVIFHSTEDFSLLSLEFALLPSHLNAIEV